MMQRALLSSLSAVRVSVLRRLRPSEAPAAAAGIVQFRDNGGSGSGGGRSRDPTSIRTLSSDAHSEFLDKGEVTDRILSIVKRQQKVDAAKVTPGSHLQNDLGLDSLDTVEIVMAFEEEFAVEIPDAEADKILTVPAAIEFFSSHPRAK